ncbi:MAG: hypothetical protein MPJ05_04780 [Nitrosopumilus sp.]|nr:hypothetical protein [Nitrosopumilus sp.]MDA7954787.1 hypothetical protein [Nitrosopumilus sp.]
MVADASLIEQYRERAVSHIMGVSSMRNNWNGRWRDEVLGRIGNRPNLRNLLDLGDDLSEIFLTTRDGGGRGQGALSGAGVSWECLVCWYCNAYMLGSRVVFIKYKKSLIPEAFRNAVTVRYGAVHATSEADLMALVFPNIGEYTDPRGRLDDAEFSEVTNGLADRHFGRHELGIISCKTNWNDNAQVPMLWDMVYTMGSIPDTNITVGVGGHLLSNLRFRYSFVTVPTNRDSYKATDINVQRVNSLSGGNYWGRATRRGIAQSIKEIFASNFRSAYEDINMDERDEVIGRMIAERPYFGLQG